MSDYVPRSQRPLLRKTLAQLAAQDGDGKVQAQALVDTCRNPMHKLHSLFEWDDTIAGEKWRLEQARGFIRFTLFEAPEEAAEAVTETIVLHQHVSLPSDRKTGGGYRKLEEVLRAPQHRKELIDEALQQLRMWKHKYRNILELSPLFDAIEREMPKVGVPRRKIG